MKRSPDKALVLAAGFGTRMRPLTSLVPKPLLPLWGRPIIDRALDLLRGWGVREVLVNLHHGADAMLDWARRRPDDGLRISLSFESDILGTGGALRRGAWFFGGEPFWIVNADIAAEVPRAPFLRALRHPRTLAALWLHGTRGPRTVEMQDGRIGAFRSHRPGTPGTYTFCGLQLVRPETLRYVPETGFATLVQVYVAANDFKAKQANAAKLEALLLNKNQMKRSNKNSVFSSAGAKSANTKHRKYHKLQQPAFFTSKPVF